MRPVSRCLNVFITNAAFSQSYNTAFAQRMELRQNGGVWVHALRASIVVLIFVQSSECTSAVWAQNTVVLYTVGM